jgi:hypothetical protein
MKLGDGSEGVGVFYSFRFFDDVSAWVMCVGFCDDIPDGRSLLGFLPYFGSLRKTEKKLPLLREDTIDKRRNFHPFWMRKENGTDFFSPYLNVYVIRKKFHGMVLMK